MKVGIKTARPLRWHADLVRGLEAAGHDVVWRTGLPGPALPTGLLWLFELERLVYRRRTARLWDVAPPPAGVDAGTRAADIELDLSGGGGTSAGDLRLLYDGEADCACAIEALLDGRTPLLQVVGPHGLVAAGLPANEDRAVLSVGLDAVLSRAVDLCLHAVARLAAGAGAGDAPPGRRDGVARSWLSLRTAAFSASALQGKVQRVLAGRLHEAHAWRVGVRVQDGPGILAAGRVPADGFRWVPDDGARYYADPFLVHHEGRTWLFVEEYPYATRKGIISVCEVRADGRCGPMRPVVEEPVHLSYPFVFRHAGAFWMIPESSGSRETVLYRAVDFPHVWRRERVLVDGMALADATLYRDGARWWLFAATSDRPGASSWDALSLFHATSLDGEFRPHRLNPVTVDVRAARPAGRMARQDGRIVRIAQNCRAGYGAGISIVRVDRLDEDDFRQTVTAELTAPAGWRASGLHTIDADAGFEAIDILSALAPPANPESPRA